MPQTSITLLPGRSITRPRDELEAEHVDAYAIGWDAGADLDDPLPCPFKNGTAARLWRKGFSARVDDYIGRRKSVGGLNASIS